MAARLALVLRYGRSATAFRALGTDLDAWYAPSASAPEAMVAYAGAKGAAVAASEPVAATTALVAVAEAFVQAQRAQGRRAVFFATEGRLARSPQLARRLIGEQPVWDPQHWATQLRGHRSLREQLRRARAKGVRVVPVAPDAWDTPAWRAALATLQQRWRATRSMPPMGFLVTQALHEGLAWRRTWVAVRGPDLVGVLSLAPVPARDGWLFEHLLRDPDAPNGTAELLVDTAMHALATDGVRWATLGLAPLHGPVDATLARIRTWSRPLFNFTGLSAFKQKLDPQTWEPIFVAWPREGLAWRAITDGLRAFAGGSLVRFGARTVLRGPTPVLRLLEWLLVPWTVALAVAPTTPWFPHLAVQGAWVLFDGALLLALRIARQWSGRRGLPARRALARLLQGLAIAVTADAALTLGEAWWFRAPWHRGGSGALVTVIAIVGPMVAAVLLWGAARRARCLARPLATHPVDADPAPARAR